MIKLSLVQLVGPYCGTHTEGEMLYHVIAPYLGCKEKVVLDFEGVQLASSSFFNELFRHVIDRFGESVLNSQITYASLKPRHQFVLDRSQPIVSVS